MTFITKGITFYLWSPWRCMAIEHRLFEAIRLLPGTEFTQTPDELSIEIKTDKVWKLAREAVERTLKGWQEEATDSGTDRRSWYWLIESDTDANGYDHNGEAAHIWCFVRLMIESGSDINGEGGKVDMIDLEGFGFRVLRNEPV
jgi:hypothetical protein